VLARALADCGDEVVFVLDDDGLAWNERVSKQGHDCVTASAWSGEPITGCLLDGYEFGRNAIQFWRAAAAMTVSIVDQPPKPDWADLIIAPGLAPNAMVKAGALSGRVLAGLGYALVDQRFRMTSPRHVPELATNIVVSFGLQDSLNATGLVLNALALLPQVRDGIVSVTVALAASAPHLSNVREQVRGLKHGVCVIDADMATCYAAADVAIGGGGLGLLERMAMGVPSVSITLAENQRQQIALCVARGGTLHGGHVKDIQASDLAATISSLLRSREQRAVLSKRAQEAVDGLGAVRCARAMWEGVRVH